LINKEPNMPIAVRTENLSYTYSPGTVFEKTAVRDVNLEIEKGEFAGIIGHTGSGKSTLIRHLNGLLKPTSGKVYIGGEDIWKNPKDIRRFRFKVGMVFQYPEYQLFEETVFKDIAFGPKNMGLSNFETQERVYEAAQFVGIGSDLMEKSPFELSGGQKRRVAIAGVIAMRPEVLILDEPTAGLDPRGRDKIFGEIKNYHKKQGSTVLLVSHSMEDIAKFASKVLVMNKASTYIYDDVEKVFAHADKISQMGLSVPQITRICMALNSKGYDISPETFTVQAAKDQILNLLKNT